MAKDNDVIQRTKALSALHELSIRHEKRVSQLIVRIEDLEIAVESANRIIKQLQKERWKPK